jgi:D-cysteine desulfhydrase
MSLPGTGRTQIRDNGLPGAGLAGLADAALAGARTPGAVLGGTALPARIKLAALPTQLVPAPRLGAAMGIEHLYVKRDDLTGFACGGNKARPLEFLVAAAREQDADTLLTGGAAGSNFCVAAAAAACRAGLSCHLVIAGRPQNSAGLWLARAWGATVSWTLAADRASVDAALPRVAAELAGCGRRPYLVPRGGATALGAIGYALAAFELHDQLAQRDLRADCVLVAVGSGGTLAGLVAGNALLGRPWRVVGASVSRPRAEAAQRVLQLARDCSALLTAAGQAGEAAGAATVHREAPGGAAAGSDPAGGDAAGGESAGEAARAAAPDQEDPERHPAGQAGSAITAGDIDIADACGPGHGIASADGDDAAGMALRTEGMVVDPVYTAKALAVLRSLAGVRRAVFWHTGGMLDAIAAAGARR